MPSRALLLALLVALVAPASATATVTVSTVGPTVVASGGDQPVVVTVTGTSGFIDVDVQGDAIAGSEGCAPSTPTAVTCVPPAPYSAFSSGLLRLSSSGDTFDATGLAGVPLVVEGLGGADDLTGTPSGDFLRGGQGADTLHGGEGNDYLELRDADQDSAASTCDAGGADVVKDDPADPVLGSAVGCEARQPRFTGSPAIAGAATVGGAFSVTGASFAGTQVPLRYEWRTCIGATCGGVRSTAATYVPTEADIGRTVQASVSATVVGGPFGQVYGDARTARSALVTAAAVPPPRAVDGAPKITIAKSNRKRKVRAGVVTFSFGRPSEAAAGVFTLRSTGKKARTIVRKRFVTGGERRLVIRVLLGKAVRKQARRKKGLRVKATLRLRDFAGDQRTRTFPVTLKAS